MIRLVTVCDPHLSAHRPAAWTADYEAVTADVLEQVLAFAGQISADAVLVAGDFFHLKAPSRNPLGFLIRTAQRFKALAPCPVLGIAGNHDLSGGSVWNGGLDGQPLSALAEMGAVELLDGNPVFIKDPEHQRAGGCWVQGASFDHGTADTFCALARMDDAHPHVNLGHFGFNPRGGGDLFGERVYGPEDLKGGEFDVAVIGHHHYDQGFYRANGKLYMAHGSPCWTGAHKADRNRRPAAGLIEIKESGEVRAKLIRPKLPPIEELMDLEKRDQIAEESEQLDEFTAQLGERLLEAPDPEAVLEDLELDGDVRARAREYLEAAE